MFHGCWEEHFSDLNKEFEVDCGFDPHPIGIYTKGKGIYDAHGTLTVHFAKACECDWCNHIHLYVIVNGEEVLKLHEGETKSITLCDIEDIKLKCKRLCVRSDGKGETEQGGRCPCDGKCCGDWTLDLHYKRCC